MPDENDIIFDTYQLNVEGIFRFFYELIVGSARNFDTWYQKLVELWYLFSVFSFILSALLLMGLIYAFIRFKQLSEIEAERLREAEKQYRTLHGGHGKNAKWQRVRDLAATENPGDWRLAILEADIMLEELLDQQGYSGSSIGDRLKTARPENFATVQDAWDAHKVRNSIAHRGSDFVLTKRATQDAIARYQRVFEEFDFI